MPEVPQPSDTNTRSEGEKPDAETEEKKMNESQAEKPESPAAVRLQQKEEEEDSVSEGRNDLLEKEAEEVHNMLRQLWDERYETPFPDKLLKGLLPICS